MSSLTSQATTINASAAVMFIAGGIVADDLRSCVSPYIEGRDWALYIILAIVLYFFTKNVVHSIILASILFILRYLIKSCERCEEKRDDIEEHCD